MLQNKSRSNVLSTLFQAWCGISEKMFKVLLDLLGEKLTDSRKLSSESKLMLFLIKLKQNQTFSALGSLFSVHRTTALSTFVEVLDLAFEAVKHLLIWPSKNLIKARMPASFKSTFPECRCIIDATEVEIQKPSNVNEQVLTFSNYKGKFTMKFLVAVAPHGDIIFVSRGYGGRITDAQLSTSCGFLNYLESGDVVLADKGNRNFFLFTDYQINKIIKLCRFSLHSRGCQQERSIYSDATIQERRPSV